MMMNETALADDQATGLQSVGLDEVEYVATAFNRQHKNFYVDYDLRFDGGFTFTLYGLDDEPLAESSTLDIDDFWRVADK